jgi:hypothetical protein
VTFVTLPRKNAEPVLIGTYWRIATDLRVSLTDRCTDLGITEVRSGAPDEQIAELWAGD